MPRSHKPVGGRRSVDIGGFSDVSRIGASRWNILPIPGTLADYLPDICGTLFDVSRIIERCKKWVNISVTHPKNITSRISLKKKRLRPWNCLYTSGRFLRTVADHSKWNITSPTVNSKWFIRVLRHKWFNFALANETTPGRYIQV